MNYLNNMPDSKLTLQKPELWNEAVRLATGLTGYKWEPKRESSEGMIYACGGGGWYTPPTPLEKINKINDQIRYYEEELEREEIKQKIRQEKGEPSDDMRSREIIAEIQKLKRQVEELDRQRIEDKIEEDKREIERSRNYIEQLEIEEELNRRRGNKEKEADYQERIKDNKNEIKKRQRRIEENSKKLGLSLIVPEGSMEWLLHEVGHWLAATKEERALPSYGFGIIRKGECTCTKNFTECRCGDEREWQAWAFEQIILTPFGDARNLTPKHHRGGIAFYNNKSIPDLAFKHIEQRLLEDCIDIYKWRSIWKQWVEWEIAISRISYT